MGAAAEGSPACARGVTRALCAGSVSTPHAHLAGIPEGGSLLPPAHCPWLILLGPRTAGDTLTVLVLSLGLGQIVVIFG